MPGGVHGGFMVTVKAATEGHLSRVATAEDREEYTYSDFAIMEGKSWTSVCASFGM